MPQNSQHDLGQILGKKCPLNCHPEVPPGREIDGSVPERGVRSELPEPDGDLGEDVHDRLVVVPRECTRAFWGYCYRACATQK